MQIEEVVFLRKNVSKSNHLLNIGPLSDQGRLRRRNRFSRAGAVWITALRSDWTSQNSANIVYLTLAWKSSKHYNFPAIWMPVKYWKHLQFPLKNSESLKASCSPQSPQNYCGSRVQHFHPECQYQWCGVVRVNHSKHRYCNDRLHRAEIGAENHQRPGPPRPGVLRAGWVDLTRRALASLCFPKIPPNYKTFFSDFETERNLNVNTNKKHKPPCRSSAPGRARGPLPQRNRARARPPRTSSQHPLLTYFDWFESRPRLMSLELSENSTMIHSREYPGGLMAYTKPIHRGNLRLGRS